MFSWSSWHSKKLILSHLTLMRPWWLRRRFDAKMPRSSHRPQALGTPSEEKKRPSTISIVLQQVIRTYAKLLIVYAYHPRMNCIYSHCINKHSTLSLALFLTDRVTFLSDANDRSCRQYSRVLHQIMDATPFPAESWDMSVIHLPVAEVVNVNLYGPQAVPGQLMFPKKMWQWVQLLIYGGFCVVDVNQDL